MSFSLTESQSSPYIPRTYKRISSAVTGRDLQVTAQESNILKVPITHVRYYKAGAGPEHEKHYNHGLQASCYEHLKITANLLIKCKFSSRNIFRWENVDTESLVISPRPFIRQLNYLPRPVSTQARWKMIFAELLPGGKCGGFDEWRDANSSLDISARNLLILTVLFLHNTKTGWRTQTIFSVIIYLDKEAREENWVRVSGYTDISSHNPPGPSEERQKLCPGECDQWSHRQWVRPWCWNGESWLVIRVEMEPPCTPE